jgi:hypothetical protein
MGFRIIEIIAVLEAVKNTKYMKNKYIYFLLLMFPYTLQFMVNISSKDNYYIIRKIF